MVEKIPSAAAKPASGETAGASTGPLDSRGGATENDLAAAKTTVSVRAFAWQQECASGIWPWPQSAGITRQHSRSAALISASGNRQAATAAGARLSASARTAALRNHCINALYSQTAIPAL